MREAIVADRIGRDPKMRDRLYLEVLNWREETPMPPPGAEESKRYRPRVVGRSRDSEHTAVAVQPSDPGRVDPAPTVRFAVQGFTARSAVRMRLRCRASPRRSVQSGNPAGGSPWLGRTPPCARAQAAHQRGFLASFILANHRSHLDSNTSIYSQGNLAFLRRQGRAFASSSAARRPRPNATVRRSRGSGLAGHLGVAPLCRRPSTGHRRSSGSRSADSRPRSTRRFADRPRTRPRWHEERTSRFP